MGGGKYNFQSNEVDAEHQHIVSLKIMRTGNDTNPLSFVEETHHDWINTFGPYVQVIDDQIIIVQGGEVGLSRLL